MRRLYTRVFSPALVCLILCLCAFAQDGPPVEAGKRKADLVELTKLDRTIKLDIRYATANNFVGRAVYTEARAFLQRPAAEAVVKVNRELRKSGLGLVIFDGYRPWSITKLFWTVVPEDHRKFVADPAKGSKHNRGCAVDLSIYDLKTGKAVPMPSGFDEFTERASPDYTGGTDEERANRDKLRHLMEAAGFTVNPNEWWHFDYNGWQEYAIYDIGFSELTDLTQLNGLVIRRIEFSGNILVKDRVLRHAVALKEGDVFKAVNFSRSIRSINSLRAFETIGPEAIGWYVDKNTRSVDFLFHLKEKAK